MTAPPTRDERAARQRISACLGQLLRQEPFFGAIAMHLLPPRPDYHKATIAADGVNFHYNPVWVAQATTDQLRYAVAHLALACALKHHTRREDRDYRRWQRASRLVTQALLIEHRLADPRQGPGENASVERVYDSLPDEPESPATNPASTWPPQPGPAGAGDNPQPDASQSYDDPQQQGEVMDHPDGGPDADPAQRQEIERLWDDAVQQSLQIARNQGNRPGNVAELVNRSQNPHIDWRQELAEFMFEHAPDESSWNHPDRRFVHRGIYLPGLRSAAVQSICFAIDTSGSLNRKALESVWSAVCEICEQIDPEYVRVIQCDAAISSDTTYDRVDLPQDLEARGRGGTSFRPVFQRLEDHPPAFLIYLTDLECNRYPEPPPDYPVLWAATKTRAPDPPFGRRLNLPDFS